MKSSTQTAFERKEFTISFWITSSTASLLDCGLKCICGAVSVRRMDDTTILKQSLIISSDFSSYVFSFWIHWYMTSSTAFLFKDWRSDNSMSRNLIDSFNSNSRHDCLHDSIPYILVDLLHDRLRTSRTDQSEDVEECIVLMIVDQFVCWINALRVLPERTQWHYCSRSTLRTTDFQFFLQMDSWCRTSSYAGRDFLLRIFTPCSLISILVQELHDVSLWKSLVSIAYWKVCSFDIGYWSSS